LNIRERTMGASAPGKLLLAGEYAVLEGAPAIVTAVQARAFALFVEGPADGPDHPEGAAARTLAETRFGAVPARLTIDATALRAGDVKLGLGSSAAIAAACAAAVAAYHGRDPERPESDVLALALEGHRAVSPEGSGADVAASVRGGLVRFERRGETVHVDPLAWPSGLVVRVVWTGKAARTSDFLRKVAELAEASPALHRERMDALRARAVELAAAFADAAASEIVTASGIYGEAMGALGEAARVPIVEARLASIDALARRFGGRAKPSGAGGGDVAVAFFADPDALPAFDAACREADLLPVEFELGGPGARATR
jgi:phosphomevalonate kinase